MWEEVMSENLKKIKYETMPIHAHMNIPELRGEQNQTEEEPQIPSMRV
jgi:hypothetical protein